MASSTVNIYSKASYVDPDLIDDYGDTAVVNGAHLTPQQQYPQPNGQSVGLNKHNTLDCKYRSNLRTRQYTTHHTYPRGHQLRYLAELPVKLIPIRLDLEIEGVKLRDTFTWNMNETLTTPEYFAQLLADDMECPYASYFVPQIADIIRKQVSEYAAAVEEDLVPVSHKLEVDVLDSPVLEKSQLSSTACADIASNAAEEIINGDTPMLSKSHSSAGVASAATQAVDNSDDIAAYGDLRIAITLDLHVGVVYLKDRFEWPLFPTHEVTPEDFSRQLAADLGVGGEFIPMIAHAIREQVVNARLNYSQSTEASQWRVRPFRNDDTELDWQPDLRVLTEEDIDRIAKEEDRNTRRLRRQRNQLGGRTARGRAAAELTISGTLQPNLPVFPRHLFPPPALSIGYVGGLLQQQRQQQQLQRQIQLLQKQQQQSAMGGYLAGSRSMAMPNAITTPKHGYTRGPYKRHDTSADARRVQEMYTRKHAVATGQAVASSKDMMLPPELKRLYS
ncbi:hypothetical protein BASA61_000838 [Batrachochytrium salamandrivorans]|nr:hypothetical protein BASA61_000838 [Batrachochytrium salamandrivorans]